LHAPYRHALPSPRSLQFRGRKKNMMAVTVTGVAIKDATEYSSRPGACAR
jgi:hypothetical protein